MKNKDELLFNLIIKVNPSVSLKEKSVLTRDVTSRQTSGWSLGLFQPVFLEQFLEFRDREGGNISLVVDGQQCDFRFIYRYDGGVGDDPRPAAFTFPFGGDGHADFPQSAAQAFA